MEEERNWGNNVVDSVEPEPIQSNEIYNNINKLNNKLDEIAELHNIDIDSKESVVTNYSNESFKSTTNNLTTLDDLNNLGLEPSSVSNFDVTPIVEESLLSSNEVSNVESNNEINMPTVSEEEAEKDIEPKKEGKGQYILITILTVILISLLLLMVYFTSSL